MTPLMGFALPKGNYRISGTQGSLGKCPTPHPTGGSQICQTGTSDAPTDYYIHISLPMPSNIVLLHPTPAKIWSSGPKPPGQTSYAVGLRLLYAEAGAPKISMVDGTHLPIGVPADGVIRFDPDPAEVQLDVSIEDGMAQQVTWAHWQGGSRRCPAGRRG